MPQADYSFYMGTTDLTDGRACRPDYDPVDPFGDINFDPIIENAAQFAVIANDELRQLRKEAKQRKVVNIGGQAIKSFRFKADNLEGDRDRILETMHPEVQRHLRETGDIECLHVSQIRSGVRLAFEQVMNPGKCGVLSSPTQGGKTGAQIVASLLIPVFAAYFRGEIWSAVSILTQSVSLERQMHKEYLAAVQVYGNVKVRCANKKEQRISAFLPRHQQLIVDQDDPEKVSFRRTNSAIAKQLDGLMETASGGRVKSLVFILDEFHWGSEKGGSIDKIFRKMFSYLEKVDEDLSFELMFKKKSSPHSIIFVSATGYELVDSNNVWLVTQSLESGVPGVYYQGLNFACGRVVDEKATVKPLPVDQISKYGENVGMNLDYLLGTSYYRYPDTGRVPSIEREIRRGKLSFIRGTEPATAKISYNKRLVPYTFENYRRRVRFALRDLIHYWLVDTNPNNGAGAIIRYAMSNSDALKLALDLRDDGVSSDIVFVIYNCALEGSSIKGSYEYQGDGIYIGKSRERVRDVISDIEEHSGPGKKFVMLVTGSARMGTQIPKEFTYFLDGTKRAGNLTTLLQGLLGRASGFGKNSHVLLTEKNHRMYRKMVTSKGISGGRVGSRAEYDSSGVRGFGRELRRVHMTRQDFLDNRILNGPFRRFEEYCNTPIDEGGALSGWALNSKGAKVNGGRLKLGNRNNDEWNRFFLFFSQTELDEIDRIMAEKYDTSVSVLRPYEDGIHDLNNNVRERLAMLDDVATEKIKTDRHGYKVDPDRNMLHKVGFRSIDSAGDTGSREAVGGDRTKLQTQILVSRRQGRQPRFDIEQIVFRLSQGVQGGSNVNSKCVATERSAHDIFHG